MSTIHFEKSRSELKTLRRLIETSCPSISELTQLKANLEPQDMFFREKLILIDSAIYTQEKSQ
jgi:hypothetical protein